MSANEFDELIKAKFEQNEFAYSPANWDKMSQRLAEAGPRKNALIPAWAALTGIAAAMAMMMVLPLLWQRGEQQPIVLEKSAPVSAPAPNTTALSNETEPTMATDPLTAASRYTIAESKPKNPKPAINAPVQVNNRPTENSIAIQAQHTEPTHTQQTDQHIIPTEKQAIQKPRLTDNTYVQANTETQNANCKRISINLVGGFNYNSSLAGYTVGASANKKISEKLYLEGNLAFVNSANTAMQKSETTMNAFDSDPGTSNVGKPSAEEAPVSTVLSYLQFSPVVGYQVSERINLGAGPDFQQLLNSSATGAGTYTSFDVGVIGKAECALSKKLKAGIQYRSAMNKYIKQDSYQKNTPDRSYMQVQLNYSLFSK
jgi:hypothetical protein